MSDSLLDLTLPDGSTPPIFRILPDWASAPDAGIEFGRNVIQYDEGATSFRYLTSDLGWSVSCDYTNTTKADENALLKFFAQQQGRLGRFWLPVRGST